jgi:hypothetical protein
LYVKSAHNYIEKLKLTEIATTTLFTVHFIPHCRSMKCISELILPSGFNSLLEELICGVHAGPPSHKYV